MTIENLKTLADSLLYEFGTEFSVIKENDTFNEIRGDLDTVEEFYTGWGAFLKSDILDFNGSFILNDDEKLYIYKTDEPINKDYVFEINGTRYAQNKTTEVIFKNEVIVRKSILKEVKQ